MANKKKNKQKQKQIKPVQAVQTEIAQEEVVETSTPVVIKKTMSLSGFIAIILSAILLIGGITAGIIFAVRNNNQPSDGLLYAEVDGGYSVVGIGSCEDEDLIIPSVFKGKYVVSIYDSAFLGCETIKTVSFAKDSKVTSIGKSAFANCPNLTTVTTSDELLSIGKDAFKGCSSLKTVTIGEKVNSIGEKAFFRCSALETVTFKSTTGWGYNYPTWKSVSGDFFDNDNIIEWFNSTEDENSLHLIKKDSNN